MRVAGAAMVTMLRALAFSSAGAGVGLIYSLIRDVSLLSREKDFFISPDAANFVRVP